MSLDEAVTIARDNQLDPEIAALELERAGASSNLARRALRAVFGYDVLGN